MSIRPTSPDDFPLGTLREQQAGACKQLIETANKVDLSAMDRILPEVDDAETIRAAQRTFAKKEHEARSVDLQIEILNTSRRLSNRLSNPDERSTQTLGCPNHQSRSRLHFADGL